MDSDETRSIAETSAAWPVILPPSAPPFGGGWGQNSASTAAAVPESAHEEDDEPSAFWPEMAADPWPSPPMAAASGSVASESSPEDARESEETGGSPSANPNHAETAEAIARATHLLDELRDAIGAIGREHTVDLSGVISDLDVAATPPGALAPDEVAELRDALLAARERPRDVDTIVDLTKRVDSLLSLVISYDRAIAAIERSLDALRNEGGRVTG